MKKLIALILFSASVAHANLVPLGSVTFTGDFTLNHLYDFNNREAQPFGWFGDQTVTGANGIFLPYVQNGQILRGAGELWSVNNLPLFTLAGFTFLTTYVGITGPDFTGRDVTGIGNLSGNGYNVDIAYWDIRSPPYDIGHFDHDITGPINLQLFAFFENGHVPGSGSTLILMGIVVVGLFLIRPLHARG